MTTISREQFSARHQEAQRRATIIAEKQRKGEFEIQLENEPKSISKSSHNVIDKVLKGAFKPLRSITKH